VLSAMQLDVLALRAELVVVRPSRGLCANEGIQDEWDAWFACGTTHEIGQGIAVLFTGYNVELLRRLLVCHQRDRDEQRWSQSKRDIFRSRRHDRNDRQRTALDSFGYTATINLM
jgi:hypothetical protein